MFVLHSFGTGILSLLGTPAFLTLYLLSGLTGSLFSITHAYLNRPRPNPYFPARPAPSGSVGASAAIAGPMVLYACMYPRAQVLLFMVLPVPAWAAIGGFFCWDLWRSVKGSTGLTDSAGHVGGAVAGLAYWWYRFRRGRGGRW
ncbi:hypothetical protein HK097_001191 [Rhizophlyctis rosea]|uniref:Peptidase S54 rhomboid domain-containing protein n=1 Tax=Rhizophlyctis rosea TaxID=64517 RepID=A0AAD5S4R0_9FUNG|nr:hypothetical protein HK097_001191 [Rhizophlyctis rosea]